MSSTLRHTATKDFKASLKDISSLQLFAKKEEGAGRSGELFLKLCIVILVTKFEVFVESILKEVQYSLRTSSGINCVDLHVYTRINSLRVAINEDKIVDKLNQRDSYDITKLGFMNTSFSKMVRISTDADRVSKEFCFEVAWPLGKHGKEELVKLFKQFEGKDIFSEDDLNQFNSLLSIRNHIVHQDASPSLITITDIKNKAQFVFKLSKKIDSYLYRVITAKIITP